MKINFNNLLLPSTIMSIDASTTSIAFAIFNDRKLVQFGKISFSGTTAYDKVVDASKKLKPYFSQYANVDAIVIEHTVFMNSPKTAADLALVQGSILGAAGVKNIRSVAPITWQNFIGNKKFSKEDKLAMRKEFPDKSESWYKTQEREARKQKTINFVNINYDVEIKDNDVADAIAIGHYAINNWERLTK